MKMTKDQLQQVLENAPAGSDKVSIIEGLYSRGVSIDGVDSYDAQKFISSYKTSQMQQQQREAAAQNPQPVNDNLGTGFTPSFESQPTDSFMTSAGKTIGNAPKSGFNLAKDVYTAVTNPIDTAKSVIGLVKGLGGKATEKALENTDIGQALLGKMNDIRVSNGQEPLQKDAEGKFQAQTTEELEMVNKVGAYFGDRYGSLSKFRESAVEDPLGVLSDIASVLTGAGAAVKGTGFASKSSTISNAGQTIMNAGNALEPVTAISKGTSGATSFVGDTTLGRSVSEAVPTGSRIAEAQVVKALDLTQGDVARISQKTGNNVTDFMVKNNIFKETPEEIVLALDDLKTSRMAEVRGPISQVTTVYTPAQVPRVQDALSTVQQSIDSVPGLESTLAEVNALLAKPNYRLSDVQRAKEILDANSSIFNRMGDARQTATAEGLANIRGELRTFIESEVSKATGGKVDIKALNSDVATAVELADAIETRATRGLTRQSLSVFDGILGFSAAAAFDPITALGVVGFKKLSETPSFRIALARTLSATPVEDVTRWSKEIADNNISPATKEALLNLIETSKSNAQFIESGAQVVDEANKATEKEVKQ